MKTENSSETFSKIVIFFKEVLFMKRSDAKNYARSIAKADGIHKNGTFLSLFKRAWEAASKNFHLTDLGNGERFVW